MRAKFGDEMIGGEMWGRAMSRGQMGGEAKCMRAKCGDEMSRWRNDWGRNVGKGEDGQISGGEMLGWGEMYGCRL